MYILKSDCLNIQITELIISEALLILYHNGFKSSFIVWTQPNKILITACCIYKTFVGYYQIFICTPTQPIFHITVTVVFLKGWSCEAMTLLKMASLLSQDHMQIPSSNFWGSMPCLPMQTYLSPLHLNLNFQPQALISNSPSFVDSSIEIWAVASIQNMISWSPFLTSPQLSMFS